MNFLSTYLLMKLAYSTTLTLVSLTMRPLQITQQNLPLLHVVEVLVEDETTIIFVVEVVFVVELAATTLVTTVTIFLDPLTLVLCVKPEIDPDILPLPIITNLTMHTQMCLQPWQTTHPTILGMHLGIRILRPHTMLPVIYPN